MLLPGEISSVIMPRRAGAVMTFRAIRIASNVTSRSSCALKKLKLIAGGAVGSDDFRWMLPVLSERKICIKAVTPDLSESLKFSVMKNGTQPITALGASNPARVRMKALKGAADMPSKPRSVNAYFSASQTRRTPRPFTL